MSDEDGPSNGTLVRLARLDERIKAIIERLDRDERHTADAVALAKAEVLAALQLASEDYDEHFERLNGETARMDKLHTLMVTTEKFEGRLAELRTEIRPALDYVKSQSGPRALTASNVIAAISALLALGALATMFARMPG